MENVVYLLGAGFSAPLGLPVMSNFLEKAKDIYFADSNNYRHFSKIFEFIDKMSYAKNYYACDLTNIEEILSILEMQQQLGSKGLRKSFVDFITDGISREVQRR